MKNFLRLLLAATCVLAGSATVVRAQIVVINPLTVAEACLMLRAGSPSDDVLNEMQARRLLAAPSESEEGQLKAVGASPGLLTALKTGTYTLSAAEANAARHHLATSAAATAAGAAVERQRQAAAAAAAAPPRAADRRPGSGDPAHMANLLQGKLVTFEGGKFKDYDNAKLASKKVFALYYSAHWCQPCKMFTPKLVAFYQQVSQAHPELEIVFVSGDHSAPEMAKYMQETGMTWPALRYERRADEQELNAYAGPGIPDLVLVSGDGRVLADSYHGKDYLGPQRVLNGLSKALGVGDPGAEGSR